LFFFTVFLIMHNASGTECAHRVVVFQHHSKTGGSTIHILLKRLYGSRFCSLSLAGVRADSQRVEQCAATAHAAARGACAAIEVHLPDYSVSAYLEQRLGPHCVTTFGIVREPIELEVSNYNCACPCMHAWMPALARGPTGAHPSRAASRADEVLNLKSADRLGPFDEWIGTRVTPSELLDQYAGCAAATDPS
jgi:hypothetical protein